ncbi:MAG: VCBS repeat-containing protein, partial [Planctomycetes bacterium]|nr:VCBS repeat-containing protein [Planctomycetota bacterium]
MRISMVPGRFDSRRLAAFALLLAVAMTALVNGAQSLRAADCNGNGVEDASDLLSEVGFLAAPSYPVGVNPRSLIAADLDGDENLDLATANYGCRDPGCSPPRRGGVSVLLNQGDGTFQTAVSYFVDGSGPQSLITADLDGDGSLDLATASQGDVSVFLNRGDGTFEAAVSYIAGSNPGSLLAADLDGDGSLDLATAFWACSGCNPTPNRGTVSVLLNQGDGTFLDAVRYLVGINPRSLIAADIDGDGSLDLATANFGCPGCNPPQRGDISVLLNQGDGTFMDAVSHAAGSSPWSVIAADLNGDGRPDLATANYGVGVSVLLNQGDGTFLDAGSYAAVGSLIAADLNADGSLDLATEGGLGVSVLLNRGDGT